MQTSLIHQQHGAQAIHDNLLMIHYLKTVIPASFEDLSCFGFTAQQVRNDVGDLMCCRFRSIMQFVMDNCQLDNWSAEGNCGTIDEYVKLHVKHESAVVGNMFWIAASLVYNTNFIIIANATSK